MRDGKGGQVVVSIRGFFIELLKRGVQTQRLGWFKEPENRV